MSYVFLFFSFSVFIFPLAISMRSCSLDVRFYVELLFSVSLVASSVDFMIPNRFSFLCKVLFPVGSFLFSSCLSWSFSFMLQALPQCLLIPGCPVMFLNEAIEMLVRILCIDMACW